MNRPKRDSIPNDQAVYCACHSLCLRTDLCDLPPIIVPPRVRKSGFIDREADDILGCSISQPIYDEFLKDAGHLIVDRDTSFIAMREFLEQNTETKVVLRPPQSPNRNAYMERGFRSLKSECLERTIFFRRKSLENAVCGYAKHDHAERKHQGLGHELIELGEDLGFSAGHIACREGLGVLLEFYHRRAA